MVEIPKLKSLFLKEAIVLVDKFEIDVNNFELRKMSSCMDKKTRRRFSRNWFKEENIKNFNTRQEGVTAKDTEKMINSLIKYS